MTSAAMKCGGCALPLLPMTYGTATSPIVFDGKVILQRDGNSTESELLALNAKTGGVAWRTPRPLLREQLVDTRHLDARTAERRS